MTIVEDTSPHSGYRRDRPTVSTASIMCFLNLSLLSGQSLEKNWAVITQASFREFIVFIIDRDALGKVYRYTFRQPNFGLQLV